MTAKPNVPSTIKVGPHRWTVEVTTEAINVARVKGSDNRIGEAHSRLLTISIDPDQAHDELADTLLHEVLHACYHLTGNILNAVAKSEEIEEHSVGILAPALLGVLRDNPDLVAFLTASSQ
ncbi:MAG TPA: hypothetical protein VHB02_06110 [Acidimicrobiales bacterium]|nr:hypothetical protein [Acidimicrobiales bacterium]